MTQIGQASGLLRSMARGAPDAMPRELDATPGAGAPELVEGVGEPGLAEGDEGGGDKRMASPDACAPSEAATEATREGKFRVAELE